MGHLVRIVLPDSSGTGPIRRSGASDNRIDCILGRIIEKWGGCTSYRAEGLWDPEGRTDGRHRVVSDRVVVCDVSIGPWNPDVLAWWKRLAADVARLWDQECVYVSVRAETAMLIGPDGSKRVIGRGE